MEQVLEDDSMWGGEETAPAEHDTVTRNPGDHRSAMDTFCMEIFGLGCVLDVAGRRKRSGGGKVNLRGPRCEEGDSFCSGGFASVYPRLRQTLLRKWELADGEHPVEHEQQPIETDSGQARDPPEHVRGVLPSGPPTPSEVLSASSIRMMLGMASVFRKTNPAVQEVVCGTMIDLLLEAPPLVLAPLHQVPTSIEANTFRGVGEFCAELVGSSSNDEREAALGLYLALAVSRGQVSGLLEVVRFLLERCRKERPDVQDVRVGEGEVPSSSSSLGRVSPLSEAAAVGAAESEQGWRGERDARISAVLDRLANHGEYLHLSFPDQWEGTRLVVRVSVVAPADSTVSTSLAQESASRQGIGRECLASTASDGKFVFIWHPEIGLLKAGTGLGGTINGRVYAHKSQAGHQEDSLDGTGTVEGFMAVIGGSLFLQIGRFVPPYRFLVFQASDLEIAGTVNAVGRALPTSKATAGGVYHRARDGDGQSVKAAIEESSKSSGDGALQGPGLDHFPLCCDGRFVYAIVPGEVNGRPSVVAVDIAHTGRVVGRPVELRRPIVGTEKPDLPAAQAKGENERCVDGNGGTLGGIPGTGGSPDSSASRREWPWWENGEGAKRGARTFCSGRSLVVCWVDYAEVAAAPTNLATRWRFRTAGASGGHDAHAPNPGRADDADESNGLRMNRMARFNLLTGECERMGEDATNLAGGWGSCAPWMANDDASNFIFRCELRRLPPLLAAEHHAASTAGERRIFLWWNRGITPRPPHSGRFGWPWALRALADQPGEGAAKHRLAGQSFSALSEIAVFVLAHLDRLGAHYLEWNSEGCRAGETGPLVPTPSGQRTSLSFCYDLAPETFTHLVGLVEMFSGSVEAPVSCDAREAKKEAEIAESGGPLGLYVLCAALRLLNVNIGILLRRGSGVTAFGGEDVRHSLLRCLLSLVQHCEPDWTQGDCRSWERRRPPGDEQIGRVSAAREALRLLVDRIDLFYPSQEHQASLLSSYLCAYGSGSKCHTVASRAVMLELLARMASQNFLRSLLQVEGKRQSSSGARALKYCLLGPGLPVSEDPPRGPETIDAFAEALLELSRAQFVRDVPQIAAGLFAAGHSALGGAGSVEGSIEPGLSSAEVGTAVMDALGAVLNLRCIDASSATRRQRSEDRVVSAAQIRKFLQLVLQASHEVLSAAIRTQTSSTMAAPAVPGTVVEALRGSLVGTLLPSCLASALALSDDGDEGGPGLGITDLLDPQLQEHLVRVTSKLRLLATPGWKLRDLEAGSSSVWPIDEFEGLRTDLGIAARGDKAQASDGGDGPTTEHRSDEGRNDLERRPASNTKTPPSLLSTTTWLGRLELLCAALGASLVRRSVMGGPPTAQEGADARWLLHPLLRHAEVSSVREGLDHPRGKASAEVDAYVVASPRSREHLSGSRTPSTERSPGGDSAGTSVSPSTFLQELCNQPASRESRALSAAMKRVVLEDRGGDPDTNGAVWAAALAAVHHTGLAGEAAEVVHAELAGRDPALASTAGQRTSGPGYLNASPALVRAWRSAQRARGRLSRDTLPTGTREVFRRRAYFLLFLEPWVSTSRRQGYSGSRCDSGITSALRTSELVLECLFSPGGTANVQHGGERGDSASIVAGDCDAERDDGCCTQGGDPTALLRIIDAQSERAAMRAKGFSLAARLLDGPGSDQAIADVLRAVTHGLRAGCQRMEPGGLKGDSSAGLEGGSKREGRTGNNTESPLRDGHEASGGSGVLVPAEAAGDEDGGAEIVAGRWHFMSGARCCDIKSRSALFRSATEFLKQCSLVLGQGRLGGRGADGSSVSRQSVLVHALRAVSMDYDWGDHDILQESQLLPVVLSLLDDADRSVAAAASEAVQVLYRCTVSGERVGSDSISEHPRDSSATSNDPSGPQAATMRLDRSESSCGSSFQKAFFCAVRRKLQDIAEASGNIKITMSSTRSSVEAVNPPAVSTPRVEEDIEDGGDAERARGGQGMVAREAAEEAEAGAAAGMGTGAMAAAQVLALAHACCRVECGRQELSTAGAIRALLKVILLAEPEMRGWALQVCRATLPRVNPDVVNEEFRSIVRAHQPSFEGSFAETCLLLVGNISAVWGRPGSEYEDSSNATASSLTPRKECMLALLLAPGGCRALRARCSAQETFSLSSELLSLLHDLVTQETIPGAESAAKGGERRAISCPSWQNEIATVACGWLYRAISVVGSLQNEKAREEADLWAEAELARKKRAAAAKEDNRVQGRPPVERLHHPAEKRNSDEDRRGCSTPDSLPRPGGQTQALGVAAGEAVSVEDLDRVVAALCVLGGQVEDVFPGGGVLCRVPRGEDACDAMSGWEESPTVEATVLRLAFSGARPPREEVSDSGDPPATDARSSARIGGAAEAQHEIRSQQGHGVATRTTRPVFSSRLLPRPPGCARPLDVYQGLTDGALMGRTAAAAAAAESDAVVDRHPVRETDRLLELAQELRRRQQVLVQNARLGSVSSRQGRSGGRVDIGRELSLPALRAPVDSQWGDGRRRDVAGVEDCSSRGSADVSTSLGRRQQGQAASGCTPFITAGVAGEGRGDAPRVVPVRSDEAMSVRRVVPRAFTKSLASHGKELLLGLKAMLEAETAFRGPTYAPLRSAPDRLCVVESAHPYQPGEDYAFPIRLEGAETVELSFDPMSRVARAEDHIALSWRTPSGGSGHRRICPCSPINLSARSGLTPGGGGGEAEQVWPGVGAEAPLVVLADELTVSSREPPAQPPSQARAMLCDLRARASMAAATLLEDRDMSAALAPLVPVLSKAALAAASEVALDGDPGGITTPSASLERRLVRAYELIHEHPKPPTRVPEAKFVDFPYAVPPAQPSSSREDSGISGGPGDGHPVALSPYSEPSYLEKENVGEAGGNGAESMGTQSLKKDSHSAGMRSEEAFPRRYVVCVGGVRAFSKPKTLKDNRSGSPSAAARLRHGARVTVVAQRHEWLKMVYDPWAVFRPTVDDNDKRPRSTFPAHVWVRQRQDDTAFLLPEELAGKETDTTAAVGDRSGAEGGSEDKGSIVTMLLGEEYDEEGAEIAEEEERGGSASWGDSTAGVESGAGSFSAAEERGTGTARTGDDAGKGATAVLTCLQDDHGRASGSLWGMTTHTLCALAARHGFSALLAMTKCWSGGPGKLFPVDLFGSTDRLWDFLRLTCVIEKGNLRSAPMMSLRKRVSECLEGEGGGAAGRHLVGRALGALGDLTARPGMKAIARVFETPHPYENKMNIPWKVHLPGSVRIKIVFDPRSRTETNCDWVDIVQDPDECAGAAAVARRGDRRSLNHRFHGREGRENFPGFGGRPPLWLEGDRFLARFQSDPSATDWGVCFTAYGILDNGGGTGVDGGNGTAVTTGSRIGATETSCDRRERETGGTAVGIAPEESAAGAGRFSAGAEAFPLCGRRGRAGTLEVELCCWVLDLLSLEGWKVPEVASRLYDRNALRVFERCLGVLSHRRQVPVLRVITSVVARARLLAGSPGVPPPHPTEAATAAAANASAATNAERVPVRPPSCADTRALLHAVVSLTEAQRAIEREASPASPYLQALIECAVILRAFLASAGGQSCSLRSAIGEIETSPRETHTPERGARTKRGHGPFLEATTTSALDAAPESPKMHGTALLESGAGAEAVQDVAIISSTLRDISQGRTPVRLLLKDFLPILTEACSVTVQSTHPFDLEAQRRVIVVPGAVGMRVRFDHRTEMREEDRIIIRNPGRCYSADGAMIAGTLSKAVPSLSWGQGGVEAPAVEACNFLRDGSELNISGLVGGTDEENLHLISVGDHVVRGPDWAFGDEDCSVADPVADPAASFMVDPAAAAAFASSQPRVGVVTALEKWGERDGAGARVRWADADEDAAMNGNDAEKVAGEDRGKGFEALYCVQNPTHLRVVRRGGADRARRPVVTGGNAVEVEVAPVRRQSDAATNDRGMTPLGGRGGSGGGSSGRNNSPYLFHFDGESTFVDLPSYRGMRLEGDFTLELWAWLDPGTAQDGKPKCLFSRSLHQPFHQSRRTATWRWSSSATIAKPALAGKSASPGSNRAARSEQNRSPPSTHAERAGPDDLSGFPSSHDISHVSTGGTGCPTAHPAVQPPVLDGGTAVDGTETSPQPRDNEIPMEGTRLVSPPARTAGDKGFGAAKTLPVDSCESQPITGDGEGHQGQGVGWEWVGTGAGSSTPGLPGNSGVSPSPLSGVGGPANGGCGEEEEKRQGGLEEEEEGPPRANECYPAEDDDDDLIDEDENSDNEESDDPGDTTDEGVCSSAAAANSGRVRQGDRGASEDAVASQSPPPGAVTSRNVYLGLRVKRGYHWRYRQKDGGISTVGTVVGTRRLDGTCPSDGDNPSLAGWTKVRWDNGRVNSYETGANGKFSISLEDAIPSTPQDLVISSATDRSISISWSRPSRVGRPALQSYVIYLDDVEIASVGAGTFRFTNTNRMRGWPYSYSVAARGPAGTSPACAPVMAATATEADRRTQLALWVDGRGEIEFAMGNERGKGLVLGAGQFQEGVWTHLAVSAEGRQVSVFVDGVRKATGNFVGRRLYSRYPSPAIGDLSWERHKQQQQQQQQQQQHEHGRPSVEPLRLGSRGEKDHWRGRLCGVRVWGAGSQAADLRRRISSLPVASFVRPAPPSSFCVTVPGTQEAFRRLRLHAPLPDVLEDVVEAGACPLSGQGQKAYYEVILRSGGCMQIGWALPSSCPSARHLGVGDDECSWAVDGMRSMKWHGNTSPVSSPYAHGVPYGGDWEWGAGDAIGCAVDLDAGVMSFSHNGRHLGQAFRRERSHGVGRYRVIAPQGVECHVGVDARSPVVEIFSRGTVLRVSQVENLSSSGGIWRLRTAEGWVAERNVDDPDEFYVERLDQDTCDFAGHGAGPERCVFVDVLRSTADSGSIASGQETEEICCQLATPHNACKDIFIRECFAEVVREAKRSAVESHVGEGAATAVGMVAQAPATSPRLPEADREGETSLLPDEQRAGERKLLQTRSLLTRSVEVGDEDAVTFFVELFLPASGELDGRRWAWGVVIADFDIYITNRSTATNVEENNSGDRADEDPVAPAPEASEGKDDSEGGQDTEKSLHIVIEGPSGFSHALPVCSAFRGRWMTMRVVAHRSGESLVVCTPGSQRMHAHDPVSDGRTSTATPEVNNGVAGSPSVTSDAGNRHQQLRCRFSNPRFFRGDRIGHLGLFSERLAFSSPQGSGISGNDEGLPFFARHAVLLLGPSEEHPPPSLSRLRQLERLVSAEQSKRLAEPTARPLLVFARRLRHLWSGEVPTAAPCSTVLSDVEPGAAADAATSANVSPPEAKKIATPTLTVGYALLSQGWVTFGSTVYFSRSSTLPTPWSNRGEEDGTAGHGRSLMAWEHPALQTPARFEAVPLPTALSRQGLRAWAPIPRSKAFLAIGLVFTRGPEPPSVTDVRCARKDLVIDATPQRCKNVTLQRTTKLPGENRGVKGRDLCCKEVIIVKEMGVCVPRDGSAWGLLPRVVLGDTATARGRCQPRWDGLMPSISGVAGQRMVVNLGHLPFRHPMDGYLPVSEVAHADARFLLQVYDDESRMWQDVGPRHGLMDARVTPRAPELIGSWSLCAGASAPATTSTSVSADDGRDLENDVFIAAAHTPSLDPKTSGVLQRLPPARAGGVLKVMPGWPPALEGGQEVWGFSMRVHPLFPAEFGGANSWPAQRFKAFASLVWGEQGQAHASNAELIRYVNTVASQKGLSKERLLTCDWATMRTTLADLADWPLLRSMAAEPARLHPHRANTAPLIPRTTGQSRTSVGPAVPTARGGVEETKRNDPPGGCSQDIDAARVSDGDGERDEWLLATPTAPVGGIRVRQVPVDNGKVLWRLSPGHVARLIPPPGGEGLSESSTTGSGSSGWRSIRGVGGERGWLALPPNGASRGPEPGSEPTLELFFAHRCILDWFSSEAASRVGVGGSGSEVDASARLGAAGKFWLPLRQRRSTTASVNDDAEERNPSPLSPAHLLGNSDALLFSAVGGRAPTGRGDGSSKDGRPLLVTGKWKVGLVTDTLTVTTRTSGCTREVAPSLPEAGSTSFLPNPGSSSPEGQGARKAGALPVLVDGLLFGFRAVDGLLIVTRALARSAASTSSGTAPWHPVEQRAVGWLGGVDEGTEVTFSILDNGEDVMFSCQEVGSRRRTATVRAKCLDAWGVGVALGVRSVETGDSTRGWVRVTSQAHGATVRSGMSIDSEAIVGRIPCGTVVPYDSAIVYHSPDAPDRGVVGIDPVVRYRCLETANTPMGWISERGRYAEHPYCICERVCPRPQQPPASISHVSVARVFVGAEGLPARCDLPPAQPFSPDGHGDSGRRAGSAEEPQVQWETEWQRRLDELSVLPARFHLLQQLNRGLSQALRYVDLSQGDWPWSTAGLVSRCRHLVFSVLKQELWQAELARTSRPLVAQAGGEPTPPSLELRLSRGRAAQHGRLRAREVGQQGRQTLFGQAFFGLRNAPTELFRLRPGEVLYSTVFVGEHAHDAGGPYRESFAEYCAELQSSALPLLIKCPNSVNDVGINREKWLPNPAIGKVGPNTPLYAEMLGFLGRLMGVAIRSQEPLDLDLPSIVWKQLVRSPITRHDLEAIDFALTQSLSAIRDLHLSGVMTENSLRDMGLGGFEVATADGGIAELPTPGGAAREVTQQNVLEFADMVEAFKMREYRKPVEAIRDGLASVIPIDHLRLFAWDELELFVCGRKDVDIDLLEACTEYSLCCRQDSHVTAFWDVLRSFSPKEKSLFLRFAWGRSRLPLSAEQFHQLFKIQAFARAPADAYLPVAHTCFFSLELPRYSSREVLEKKLRYAIYNCRAVDADDTSVGRSAAGLGWGEDP